MYTTASIDFDLGLSMYESNAQRLFLFERMVVMHPHSQFASLIPVLSMSYQQICKVLESKIH